MIAWPLSLPGHGYALHLRASTNDPHISLVLTYRLTQKIRGESLHLQPRHLLQPKSLRRESLQRQAQG